MEPYDKLSKVSWLETCDSTNAELRRGIDYFDNMSVIATVEQTAGRGQGSHSWYATPGKNLTFSILLKPSGEYAIKATDAILLTCITSLAVRSFLLEKGITARIKWPNDIWVEDRKICGMLIENRLDGSLVRESIIGIGLNINEKGWPSDLPNPISLSELTGGAEYNLDLVLTEFLQHFESNYQLLSSEKGRAYLLDEYNKYMFRLEQ